MRRVHRGHAPRGGSCAAGCWDMPEGCTRSGSGMELAKGRCVRAGSRGRGWHENRVDAVAGHAALNHVDTNFWRAGDGGRPSRELRSRSLLQGGWFHGRRSRARRKAKSIVPAVVQGVRAGEGGAAVMR